MVGHFEYKAKQGHNDGREYAQRAEVAQSFVFYFLFEVGKHVGRESRVVCLVRFKNIENNLLTSYYLHAEVRPGHQRFTSYDHEWGDDCSPSRKKMMQRWLRFSLFRR